MECTHCDESIDRVIRTGERKYSCGACNMVIAYDDLSPNLDDLEVDDQRESDESSTNDNNNSNSSGGSGNEMPTQQANPISEREKIYQRGQAGLKEIKKERLDNWLSSAGGAGAQTQQRIEMMFERNKSVHTNPNVLYNLLDDELSASSSFLNTMVQDIFEPEKEHSDVLSSQGYVPWHRRGSNMAQNNQQMGQGGPMNATGASQFNPGQSSQPQQRNQPPAQQYGQPQQSRGQQRQQKQTSQPSSQSESSSDDSGNDGISRQEAQMMMQQALDQSEQQQQKNALLSGLSDATDEAMREMASNVGGLAGTMQKVIDEALVSYARENPEWVIENMDILQKVLGATEDMGQSQNSQENTQPKENKKIDNAVSNISNQQSQQTQPSMNSRQESNNPQNRQTQSPPPQQNPQPQSTHTEPSSVQENKQQQNTEQTQDKNPDLNDDMLGDSGFDPSDEPEPNVSEPDPTQNDSNSMSASPENQIQEESSNNDDNLNEQSSTDESKSDDTTFENIFGDVAEE